MEEEPTKPEKFEIAIRLLGNEILAFSIFSESKRKAWIAISIISIIVLLMVANQFIPLITTLASLN
jgi:hypothetical protein